MKTRLHFHSDNKTFAGSENMLDILINSNVIQNEYQISFSYIYSGEYSEGFKSRFKNINFEVYPIANKLRYPNLKSANSSFLNKFCKNAIRYTMDWISVIRFTKVFIDLFKQINPNIIHINNGGYPGSLSCRVAAIISSFSRQSRTVFVVNNRPVNYSPLFRKFDKPFDFLVVKSVDKFVTGSIQTAKNLKLVLNLPQDKIQVIHNATQVRDVVETREQTLVRLNLQDFSGLIFAIVSDLVPRKGHVFLLESLAIMRAKGCFDNRSCIFILEGIGDEQVNIQEKIKALGLSDLVKLIGREKRIFEFLRIIDVLILPSNDFEDLPNVITEAMSVRKPVIATKVGGTDSQIEHMESGILIGINNYFELENAILELATNQSLRLKMGSRAYDLYLEKFQPEIASKEYLEMYRSLLKERSE
jgi:glycosyltransferase involved in cell wall biosynthesis